MTTIYADFNARTVDDRVRLATRGSQAALRETGVGLGDWVWLSDGEVRVGAHLEDARGELVARVFWDTAEEILAADASIDSAEINRALAELQGLMGQGDRDNRRVLELLPLASRRLDEARICYARARATQGLGHEQLALLAIEDALVLMPGNAAFVYQRLELLKRIKFEQALREAKMLLEDPATSAMVLAACSGIFNAHARNVASTQRREVSEQLLAGTARFESASGFVTLPPSVRAAVYIVRGFAQLQLDRHAEAVEEFNSAIAANPSMDVTWAARGMETYPSADSVSDLERAVELEFPGYWPAFYLAHNRMITNRWSDVEHFSVIALGFEPPASVAAYLNEWEAIARFQRDGNLERALGVLASLKERFAEREHLQNNFAILAGLRHAAVVHGESTLAPTPWHVDNDQHGQTLELLAASSF